MTSWTFFERLNVILRGSSSDRMASNPPVAADGKLPPFGRSHARS